MLEPPNAELMLLTLAHVRAGAHVEDEVPEFGCETCGTPVPAFEDKCEDCIVATECEDCSADVGTEEIGRNGGKCDDCAEDPHQAYEEL